MFVWIYLVNSLSRVLKKKFNVSFFLSTYIFYVDIYRNNRKFKFRKKEHMQVVYTYICIFTYVLRPAKRLVFIFQLYLQILNKIDNKIPRGLIVRRLTTKKSCNDIIAEKKFRSFDRLISE